MHILIGIGLALVLLYFWLCAHWFARVIVFLLLTVTIGFMASPTVPGLVTGPEHLIAGFVYGGIIGWFVSGIPTYYWHHQMRQRYLRGW
jgi:hypothetical protein